MISITSFVQQFRGSLDELLTAVVGEPSCRLQFQDECRHPLPLLKTTLAASAIGLGSLLRRWTGSDVDLPNTVALAD